jgi:hypothetical protein
MKVLPKALNKKQTVRQNVQKAQFDADANYETYLAAVEAEKLQTGS